MDHLLVLQKVGNLVAEQAESLDLSKAELKLDLLVFWLGKQMAIWRVYWLEYC